MWKDIIQNHDANFPNQIVLLADNITGEIQHDGQLIANLYNETSKKVMYRNRAQEALCRLLMSMSMIKTIPPPSDQVVVLPWVRVTGSQLYMLLDKLLLG